MQVNEKSSTKKVQIHAGIHTVFVNFQFPFINDTLIQFYQTENCQIQILEEKYKRQHTLETYFQFLTLTFQDTLKFDDLG